MDLFVRQILLADFVYLLQFYLHIERRLAIIAFALREGGAEIRNDQQANNHTTSQNHSAEGCQRFALHKAGLLSLKVASRLNLSLEKCGFGRVNCSPLPPTKITPC